MVAGVHDVGSPIMETITMTSRYDLEPLKEIARHPAGFNKDIPRCERDISTPGAMLDKFKKTSKSSSVNIFGGCVCTP